VIRTSRVALVALALLAAACKEMPNEPATKGPNANHLNYDDPPNPAGFDETPFTVTHEEFVTTTKTTTVYDWTIGTNAVPSSSVVGTGQTQPIQYTLTATRTQASQSTTTTQHNHVCIRNDFLYDRQTLKRWEAQGVTYDWRIDRTASLPQQFWTEITPNVRGAGSTANIAVDEERCLDLGDISFPQEAGYNYRITIHIFITNYPTRVGSSHIAATIEVPFTTVEESERIDEAADVVETLSACPSYFTCTPSGPLAWNIPDPGNDLSYTTQIPFTVNVTNVSAPCSYQFPIVDDPDLTENDTKQLREDQGTVTVMTPACPPPSRCAATPGYWKNHESALAARLPVWLGTANTGNSILVTTVAEGISILNRDLGANSKSSNGLSKLMSHLLAVKLNLLNGSDPTNIAATVAAADALLAQYSETQWASLTAAQQAYVLSVKDRLDAYNNGLLGVVACD
jgi:hypothetical protein